MTLADLSQLPPVEPRDPATVFDDLFGVITDAIVGRPRSQQTRLGPSEIGIPCGRRLAHKLAGTPEVNPRGPAWRPQVGVAVHEWLAGIFIENNRGLDAARWLVEFKVQAGAIGDQVLDGSCDLYDRATNTVIDWKIVGAAALKRYRSAGPGEQYRVQAQTYALGWANRGLHPTQVAIVFLPSAGELGDTVTWAEPFKPGLAYDAIDRVNTIAALTGSFGSAAAAMLPTAPAHCAYCPYFAPAVTQLTEACPGHINPPEVAA